MRSGVAERWVVVEFERGGPVCTGHDHALQQLTAAAFLDHAAAVGVFEVQGEPDVGNALAGVVCGDQDATTVVFLLALDDGVKTDVDGGVHLDEREGDGHAGVEVPAAVEAAGHVEGLDAQRVPRRNAQGHAEVAVVPLDALQGVTRRRGRRRGAARTVAQRHVEVFEDLAFTADLGHRPGDGQGPQSVGAHGGAVGHGIDGHHDVGPDGADGGRVRGPVSQFAFEADLDVVRAAGQVKVDRNGRDP